MEQTNIPQQQEAPTNFRKRRKEGDGIFFGILLVVVGAGLILNKMYPELPNWIVSWKTFLIVLGIFLGAKQQFKPGGWVAPIIIGTVFLVIENFPDLSIRPYLWPIAIIVFGLMIIFKNKYKTSFSINNSKDNNHLTSGPLDDRDAKRPITDVIPNPDKVLVIEGTVMMGGIDIRSY